MKDYVIVHTPGQSSWHWSKIWALMTSPKTHPPALFRRTVNVHLVDLPGHGSNDHGDTGEILREECVFEIEKTVESNKLRDYVLVAHGFSASLVMESLSSLETAPSKIVLISGVVTSQGKSLLSLLPFKSRNLFRLASLKSKLFRRPAKLSPGTIRNYVCNGMDPMDVIQNLGFYESLPSGMLEQKSSPFKIPENMSVIYVKLSQDKILPPSVQQQIANDIGASQIIDMEACHQVSLQRPAELAELLLSV